MSLQTSFSREHPTLDHRSSPARQPQAHRPTSLTLTDTRSGITGVIAGTPVPASPRTATNGASPPRFVDVQHRMPEPTLPPAALANRILRPAAAVSTSPNSPEALQDEEEMEVLRANNEVLQRNVTALKRLAQDLADKLKAAEAAGGSGAASFGPLRLNDASGLRESGAAPPLDAAGEADVRLIEAATEHQRQMTQLCAVIAAKDSVISQLSEQLEEQDRLWHESLENVIQEKNEVIASLVNEMDHAADD